MHCLEKHERKSHIATTRELMVQFALAACRPLARTVARIFTTTALLNTKARTCLITDVQNVDPLFSNKLNIS